MYTKDELAIVDYIESDKPQSVDHLEQKTQQLKSAAKAKYSKRKAINIKVLESDIERFKAKALSEGMPYQTLINSILHKYITGQLTEKH
ncbi:BrnA antitoxin family protein [sulfur-oxidizing endosymbiont of Gigantopelta aegis]|uniref:BrnA antitoxin family protein n=1 Tax=sulfur-oxidizing endosymbiont of Gigantopelta aegis TaxID=2794934 RepID=UPI0018DD9BAD|nr:BrnA antitoxin family protein [sulfur-oxidizing endosymbiont of Gigantopelta aegis]